VSRALDVEVVSLHLIDPRFYHLDTCFCPLNERTVLSGASFPTSLRCPSRSPQASPATLSPSATG
jgi:hypothetical protein